MMRAIFASNDIAVKMKAAKQKRIDVYSFFPVDKGDCACAKMISEWQDKLHLLPQKQRDQVMADTEYLTCPKSKVGMHRYQITCTNCGEIQGYCWASNQSLDDFCDFHYVNYTNGKQWFGCYTPNVSPITQQLTLECTCGNDSRDFRANQTLAYSTVEKLEREAKKGREFGKADSRYSVMQI